MACSILHKVVKCIKVLKTVREGSNLKKAVIVSFVTICLLAMAGCAETPKEVKENMKKYGDETKKIANVEVTYCKPDQVEASVEKAKKLSLQNFKLPEKIDFSSVKQLSILEMQVPSGFKKYADDIAKLCGLNIPKWTEDKGNFYGDDSLVYDDHLDRMLVGHSP